MDVFIFEFVVTDFFEYFPSVSSCHYTVIFVACRIDVTTVFANAWSIPCDEKTLVVFSDYFFDVFYRTRYIYAGVGFNFDFVATTLADERTNSDDVVALNSLNIQ